MLTRLAYQTPQRRFGAGTLPGLLQNAAASSCSYIFTRTNEEDTQLSFTDLALRAALGARVLRARGVGRGDRVCLLAGTSIDLVAAIWSVWQAGAAVVVLPPPARGSAAADYPAELALRMGQAGSTVVLLADEIVPLLQEHLPGIDSIALSALSDPISLPPPDDTGRESESVRPDELALLQFTSGTTARSRAVALTHGQLLANLSAFSDALELSSADRGLSWLPLFHDMGLVIMIAAVAAPGDLVLMPTEDFLQRPGEWLDNVSRLRATVTVAPNIGYALAARDLAARPRDLQLSQLRVAGNGAEAVDPDVLDRFRAVAGRYGFPATALCPMYGMAEATLALTINGPRDRPAELLVSRTALETAGVARHADPGPDTRRMIACGPTVPGVELEIRSTSGTVAAPDTVGEIWVRGPSIMSGYWSDPDASAEVLIDGWLRTGDLGFVYDGQLVVCGRIKDMIVAGGRNIYPEEYEQAGAEIDGVRRGNVIAFGLPATERIVVVAETSLQGDEARRLATTVLTTLTRHLAHAPQEVLLVSPGSLPKTTSGKLKRDACRRQYAAGSLAVIATGRRA